MLSEPCIEWTGHLDDKGYGKCRLNKKWMGAHRKAWILENGPIPIGMWIFHMCDNPKCINVKHLYLGTPAENARDRDSRGRNGGETKRLATTHCPQGHEYTPENTRYGNNGSHRAKWCKTCDREKVRRYKERKRNAQAA